ncbi:MAG: hypothetical protein R3F14_33515 [Polyangiaceae bacterium]
MRGPIIVGVALLCGCAPLGGDQETASSGEQGAPARSGNACACPPGTLDTTFGGAGTGIARLSIKPDDGGGFLALAQDDRGIVAAGYGFGGLGGSPFKVARLTSSGAPDLQFGGGEVVETQWGASTANYAFARGVGVQQGGKVVAIGGFESPAKSDVALARYDSSGALDQATFGDDGKPLIDLGGVEIIEDGLVTAEDAIVAVGARDGRMLVARFTPQGRLDLSFAGGTGYFDGAPGGDSKALAVTLDAAGRILAAGSVRHHDQLDVLVVRLSCDGVLDPSFGTGGVVIAGAPDVDERAVDVAVASDGAIVVAGDSGGETRDFQVRRFLEDGSPDLSFAQSGVVTSSIAGGARPERMALLADGQIVVAGNTPAGGASGPVVVRYTASGALDASFGAGGVVHVNLGDYGVLHAVAIDRDGGALLAGGDEGATPGPGTYAVVARLCM